MSGLSDVKERLQRVAETGNRVREQLMRLKGPEGEELKEQLRQRGKRIGIGVGLAMFGLSVVLVASVYIMLVLILLLNIALDRLWLSALLVVFFSFIFGGALTAAGVRIVKKNAQQMPWAGGEIVEQIKEAREEVKVAVGELQELARQKAEERQKKMQELMQQAKVVAPYAVGALAGLQLIKMVVRARRRRFKRLIQELLEEEE